MRLALCATCEPCGGERDAKHALSVRVCVLPCAAEVHSAKTRPKKTHWTGAHHLHVASCPRAQIGEWQELRTKQWKRQRKRKGAQSSH